MSFTMEKCSDMEYTCPAAGFAPVEEFYNDGETSCPANMTTGTKPLETAVLVFHIFFTIVPILFSIAFAVVAARKIQFTNETWRFLLDFLTIVIPIILNVTVLNPFVEVICVVLSVALYLLLRKCGISLIVDKSSVVSLGHQPNVLTLLRATINVITAVCILAIDFSSFPRMFRKSRTYGVGLMDTGIGLFVFSMGVVSKPPKLRKDFIRLPKMVGPALLLGLARTIVIQAIDYHQDSAEYGTHLNAFFTLGFTKLIGGLVSAIVTSELQLLLLGSFILTTHEAVLHLGLAEFVMDPSIPRETFLSANREGICSLPGFVGTYLISMYVARVLFTESTLLMEEYSKKVKRLAIATICSWIILLICIPTLKISRVVSNFGYVTWIMTIALTMLLFYILLFDYAFHAWTQEEHSLLPSLIEAINRNGLVFFLVANILTGLVNILLNTDDQGTPSSILILIIYMLLSTTLVYVLLKLKIKIA